MRRELVEVLVAAAPSFFRDDVEPCPFTRDGKYNFDAGDGWFQPLLEMAKNIEWFNRDYATPVHCTQVKEKFGRLCVYCSEYDEPVICQIDEAVQDCLKTCEVCGSQDASATSMSGWIRCLCSQCVADWSTTRRYLSSVGGQ